MSIAAGQSIGNYRILSKLGTGGMGAVYLAEHPLIGKKVALKVIHRELAGNRDVVSRFFQEARAVNKIGNEHIVEIHDFGVTPEGDHFYIMEYLEGQTLASVLGKESVFGVMRALHIGAQMASALAAAHASGVIHRDLKPDNIMLMKKLGDPDFVKVLDFGLAKMFLAGTSSVKTAAGVLLGTPQYMSPEACESKRDVDHRTDIYALGILLFQMMTGMLPFDGETMGEVLVKQVTALPPAPRGLNPAIPPAVEQILLRCLAKRVDQRFSTMNALREALLDPESYLRASPPVLPARSVAPGLVDAKMLAAYQAAQQQPVPVTAPYDPHAPTLIAAPAVTRSHAVPGLTPPAEPKMNTMRIMTPAGYTSQPRRRMWPIVLGLGLLLGVGGGVFAVAWSGRDHGAAAIDAGAKGSSDAAIAKVQDAASGPLITPIMPVIDAAVIAPIDARAMTVAPVLVRLAIESSPPGAEVIGPDHVALGKTPLNLEWPVGSDPVNFELHLAGYRKKPMPVTVTSSTTVRVDLEALPKQQQLPHRPQGSNNDLMRPGD